MLWIETEELSEDGNRIKFKPPEQSLLKLRPRYNIARLMRWGLIPSWAKDEKIGYKLINARAETVAEKPA